MTASVKRIKKVLGVDDAQAKGIRAAMKLGESGPREAEDAMDAIDSILQTFGVEIIRGDYVDKYHYDIVAYYANTGETYSPTVLYETYTGRFLLTSYGDWIEHSGAECGVY